MQVVWLASYGLFLMRRATINLNVSHHHRARGQRYGTKIEIGAKDLPMSLLHAMRNLALQWRAWWGGPFSTESPIMRVLWGWTRADNWTPGFAYVRHESNGASRVKWTCSRSAIRLHTGQDFIPLGKWTGELTCEPDEEQPLQIALIARPAVYVPRIVPVRRGALTVPLPGTLLPRLDLP